MSACISDPEGGRRGEAASGVKRRVSKLLEKILGRRTQPALEATLADLEEYQLDDIGITRGEIPAYARASAYALRHMTAMLDSLKIVPESVPPGSLARGELLKVCSVCPNPAACEGWLLTGDPAHGYRTFCPNAALLDKLPRRLVPTPADA